MAGLTRYSVIEDKNPREIVLLRGRGCAWSKCAFCDYHLDASKDESANFALNREALARVTGRFSRLEAINSGSFAELDERTVRLVETVCREKGIRDLHIESHWLFRNGLPALRSRFAAGGITLHVKIGVETFDADYRERVLRKGIPETDPAKIAEKFDDCCLLFGLSGQTAAGMARDIETGLKHFDRVCVNLMVENSTAVKPDKAVRAAFVQSVYPVYKADPRVDILLNNTDFGVGGMEK
ncbi:MAG: radical SAM protein [Eubacteriales bacterium]|nr:radical SAM protein [Eubacteriales bacterium]